MPAYDYKCKKCDIVRETVRKMSDDSKELCLVCNGEMQVVFNSPKITYKGSGWAWQEKISQETHVVIGADPSKKK
jgi:putative FmdB family regulatory protein